MQNPAPRKGAPDRSFCVKPLQDCLYAEPEQTELQERIVTVSRLVALVAENADVVQAEEPAFTFIIVLALQNANVGNADEPAIARVSVAARDG